MRTPQPHNLLRPGWLFRVTQQPFAAPPDCYPIKRRAPPSSEGGKKGGRRRRRRRGGDLGTLKNSLKMDLLEHGMLGSRINVCNTEFIILKEEKSFVGQQHADACRPLWYNNSVTWVQQETVQTTTIFYYKFYAAR